MKLYTSVGPNPHMVRMFAAERGVALAFEEVDLLAGDNRKPPYTATNPAGQMPALETDSGEIITEITAICEYLDETATGGESLIGDSPEERAQTRRWTRWVDLNIVEPLTNGFRFAEGLPLFESRMRCIPHAADDLKACAREKLAFLDAQMAGRNFVAGDRLSMADVTLFVFLAFGKEVGQPHDTGLVNVHAWYERMAARPSAAA